MIEEQIEKLKASAKQQLQANQKLEAEYNTLLEKRDATFKEMEAKHQKLVKEHKALDSREEAVAVSETKLGERYKDVEKAKATLIKDTIAVVETTKKADDDLKWGKKHIASEESKLAERVERLDRLTASLDTRKSRLDKRSGELDTREAKIADSLNKLDDEIAEATNGNKDIKDTKEKLAFLKVEVKTKEKELETDKLKYSNMLKDLTKRENEIKDKEDYQEEEAIKLQALWDKVDRKIEIHKLRGELNEQKK